MSGDAVSRLVRFGCTRVQDDWNGSSPIAPGVLALTNALPPYAAMADVVVHFDHDLVK